MKHTQPTRTASFRTLTTSVALPWGEGLILLTVAAILLIGA